MPLIACRDCGKNVSDAAPACPHCGRPIAATVIEQTGKGIKKLKVIGGVIFLVGLMVMVVAPGTGLYVLAGGLALYVVASFQGWWQHG